MVLRLRASAADKVSRSSANASSHKYAALAFIESGEMLSLTRADCDFHRISKFSVARGSVVITLVLKLLKLGEIGHSRPEVL